MISRFRISLACVSVLVLPACAHFDLKVPAPAPSETLVAPDAPQSSIAVLGGISLNQLGKVFDSVATSQMGIGCANTCSVIAEDDKNGLIRFGAYKTGAITVSMSPGGNLKAYMPVTYRVGIGRANNIIAGCGYGNDPPHHGTAVVVLRVALGSNWQPNVQVLDTHFELTEQCRVTALNIPVNTFLERYTNPRMNALVPSMVAKLNRVQLAPVASKAWAAINKPVAVTDGVWLVIHPEALGASVVVANTNEAEVALGVLGRPELVLSKSAPEATATRSLPAPSDFGVNDSVSASLDLRLPWTKITQKLNDSHSGIVGQEVTLFGAHKVKIRHFDAVSTRDGMGLAVSVDGAVKARLYVSGTPQTRSRFCLTCAVLMLR